MLRAIRQVGRPKYRVVGFIGCDARLVGTRIEGVPIVGDIERICADLSSATRRGRSSWLKEIFRRGIAETYRQRPEQSV